MRVFFTNYHISVNPTLVDDLLAIGCEVIMPAEESFAKGRIEFFANNREHEHKPGVSIVSYAEFMKMPPMAMLAPCIQLVEDFTKLYKERGEKDVMVYLTANSNAVDVYPLDGSDYILTHDLYYHRATKAKYKMMYFNRPTVLAEKKNAEQLRKSFEQKKIKLYINNFDQAGYEPEYADALKFREMYKKKTGWTVPFYGYGMKDGWPQPEVAHKEMVDSMFSLVFKRRETWGQMVNESMMLGTPCVFLNQYIHSTFTQYLINQETAIVGDTVKSLVDQILALSWEQYQTLVNEAYSQSFMFCNDDVRREKLAWLFGKVASDPKLLK